MTDTSGSASGGTAARTVGTRVGEYELVHDLGAHGETSVFLARSKGANGIVRVVVLELVSDVFVQRAGGAEALKDSAQNAIKVKSLNVVSPLDVKDDGGLAVVSDTVDGATLHEVLEAARSSGEKVGLDVALRIVVDALAGLNAAHQTKPTPIVHGGVTPERLIVASEGTTKVTDFALARWRDEAARGPYALAPSEAPSIPNDVFSAGVLAFELITGKRLFGGESPVVTDRAGEIPAPSTLADGVGAKLDAAIAKALSRDPSARFATTAEFSRAIESSGTKVALRSAVGALITKLLKEPLAQRRDLVRRLRTAGTAMSAASGFAAGIAGATAGAGAASAPPAGGAPVRMPGRPMPGAGGGLPKPGEGLRKPTMLGVPKPTPAETPTAEAAKESATDASATEAAAEASNTPSATAPAAPSASKFGAPLVAPGGALSAPKPLGVAPVKIAGTATSKADSTMPLEVGDVVSVPPPTPDRTMNVDIAEVTEIAASETPSEGKFAKVVTGAATPPSPPSTTNATATSATSTPAAIPSATTTVPGATGPAPTPPTALAAAATESAKPSDAKPSEPTASASAPAAVTTAASGDEAESLRDSEIPVEAYESLPPDESSKAAATAAPVPKLSVPPAPTAAPTGEGFDDEDIKPKPKGPISLPTQSIDGLDDSLDLPTTKSKTPLYAGIAVVALLLVGGIAIAMRGGSSSTTAGSSPTTTAVEADAGGAVANTTTATTPDVSTATVPAVAQNNVAENVADAGSTATATATSDASAMAANEVVDAGAAETPTTPTPPVAPEPPTTVATNDEPPVAPPPARTPPHAHVPHAHATPPARTAHATPPARTPPAATRRPPPATRAPANRQPTPPANGRREFRPGGL